MYYGYVYVIGMCSPGRTDDWFTHFKFGVSFNSDINIRLKSLQTGAPEKLKLIKAIKINSSKGPYAIESFICNKFKDHHTHGEWFKFSAKINNFIYYHFQDLGELIHG